MKNNRSLKKQSAKIAPVETSIPAIPVPEVDFTNSFILTDKGNLIPRKPGPFHEGAKPMERKFKSEDEIHDLIFTNRQILFGENTLFFKENKEVHLASLGRTLFNSILFDFRNIHEPRLYFVAVLHNKQSFQEFFFRMTDYFASIRNTEAMLIFLEVLREELGKNHLLKKELKEKVAQNDSAELLGQIFKRKPTVLLAMDGIRQELLAIMETYRETWGVSVKPIVIKKFASNGDTLVTVEPDFNSIQNAKKKKADIVSKTTEEAHLESVSGNVKEVYVKIKTELMKEDSSLLFNVQQNYISMRKTRNLAFFHLRKKNLYLVVMCAEKEVRKLVKHHIIKTLPESVQKFWNGASTGIMIEQATYLEEIANLLKKMVGNGKINGNEPAKQEEGASKMVTKAAPKLNPQAKVNRNDKKLKAKKK